MELKDYYFILRVPRTATARDILQAYRALAKLYHPDRAGEQSGFVAIFCVGTI
jgi:curved DNA-binding protein CbpA